MLYDIIENSANKYPDNIALYNGSVEITYNQLKAHILHFAGKLADMGIAEGDRVLLIANNCNEFIIAFFAVNYLGAVLILADTKWNNELDTVFGDNLIKVVVTTKRTLPKIKKQLSDTEKSNVYMDKVKIILTDEAGYFYSKADNKDNNTVYQLKSKKEDSEMALILYTSGSMNKPKAVVNSNANLLHALDNALETVPMYSDDKLVCVVPLIHSYPIGSCMLPGLYSGSELILFDMFNPKKLLHIIGDRGATCFHGVPFIFEMITNYMNKSCNLDTLRLTVSGGAPLPLEVARKYYEQTGKTIHQEYGSSETGTIFMNRSSSYILNSQSPGRPMKNVAVRLYDKNEAGIGRIQIKSKGMAAGYLDEKPFSEEWYDMGDLGKWDNEGNLIICGRVKRIINISGLKVSPEEIESVLLTHPLIADCVVRGEQHKESGEAVVAYIVRNDNSLSKEKLKLWCSDKLAMYKIPKRIYWVDKIETKGIGKRDFRNILQKCEEI